MSAPLASIFQLASSALPVGGFAYSRGLEAAVERGWVRDARGALAWVEGLLLSSWARLDAPLLARLHGAFADDDRDAAEGWARLCCATRETAELARESRAMAGALARWAVGLELATPQDVRPPVSHAYVAVYALAAQRLGIERDDALRAFLWSSCEASVAAAIKLVPLGQTDGQRILRRLGGELERGIEISRATEDDAIGALTPGLAIASAWHETQHTRLFRS